MPARGFLNRVASKWSYRTALVGDEREWTYRELADIVKARRHAFGFDGPHDDGSCSGTHCLTPALDDESLIDMLAYWGSNEPFALFHAGWTDRERENAQALLERGGREDGGLERGDVVFFSSGTTGLPKAVVHTRESLYAGAAAVAGHFELTPRDRWYSPLALSHVGGFAPALRALTTGGSVVLPAHGGARTLRGSMEECSPTIASLVPTMLRSLFRDPVVASLRLVMVGGDALDEDDLVLAEARGYPIAPTYGMTETGAAIVDLRNGRAIGETSVRADSSGELSIRGASLFRGYLTARGVEPACDADGWFATGDRGRVSESGRITVEGRVLPSFITTGGETIDATEVESVLAGIEGVERAIVVGVPDAKWGRVVGAVVTAREGAVSVETVRRHCANSLANAKRPRLLAIVAPGTFDPHASDPAHAPDSAAAAAHLLAHGTAVRYG